METALKIDVDGDVLAKKVVDALATSMAASMIRNVLSARGLNEENIGRQFDRATEEVAKEIFLDHLRNSVEFKAKCRKAIEAKLTDVHVDGVIKAILQRTY
jgi:hypothetical protein